MEIKIFDYRKLNSFVIPTRYCMGIKFEEFKEKKLVITMNFYHNEDFRTVKDYIERSLTIFGVSKDVIETPKFNFLRLNLPPELVKVEIKN